MPLEVFIDIESEDDLYDLFSTGQISEDTLDNLLILLARGVDLSTATRADLYSLPNLTYEDVDAILAYRAEAGFISEPAALVLAGALSEAKFLAIAPFLLLSEPERGLGAHGWIRAQTRWSAADEQLPPMGLRARLLVSDLTVGVVASLTRRRVDDVAFDPNRDALSAEAAEPALHVPKAYAHWETDDYELIVGTYRVGFGQRLTFDNSSEYTPNGVYYDDELVRGTGLSRACSDSRGELDIGLCDGRRDLYETPDFRWRDGLLGVASGVRSLPLGAGELQAYAFASAQPRSVYQYEIYDAGRCDDPRDDDDPACAAPAVYRRQDDLLAPTGRLSFQTLPSLYREELAGGNLSYATNRRTHLGVTGYGARVDWLVDGIDLDFQEWARTPYGGPFGAVGVDAAWGHRWLDVFVEAARSFDSMPSGGDFGAITRATATWDDSELEAVVRYYGEGFANPFARPIAAADENDGNRARDETGARVQYRARLDRVAVRASVDVWTPLSTTALAHTSFARADVDLTRSFASGLWVEYRDRGPSDGCDEAARITVAEGGELIGCDDRELELAARLRYAPSRRWSLAGQYTHELIVEPERPMSEDRQDVSTWLVAMVKPTERVRGARQDAISIRRHHRQRAPRAIAVVVRRPRGASAQRRQPAAALRPLHVARRSQLHRHAPAVSRALVLARVSG